MDTDLEASPRRGGDRMAAWRRANPDKAKAMQRRAHLRRMGLTPERFDELLAGQGGRCAICRTPEPGGRGSWHVDHDHSCCPRAGSCGLCVRALLCYGCNVGLGSFRDDLGSLRAAVAYLEEWAVRTEG